MFALRGISVSLSVFLLVYAALSIAVGRGWRWVALHLQRQSPRRVADVLFTLRVLPLSSAILITAVFTVPSFLLLEPRTIDEPIGGIPLALGVCGLIVGMIGIINAAFAMRRTSQAIAGWTRQAQPIATPASVPVLRILDSKSSQNLSTREAHSPATLAPVITAPAMLAAGIARPKVLISGVVESLLSAQELRSALNHEVVHVRRRDNLKKLVLRFIAFPGMAALESAGLEATEMAADDEAVASAGEALDLASALIKLSRVVPTETAADLTAALLHSPASVVNARVERLIVWDETKHTAAPQPRSAFYGLCILLIAAAACIVTYSQLLVHVHTATEWMVR